MNLRSLCLLPPGAAYPEELTAVSPTALRGPSHAEWTAMAASKNYTGKAAILAHQQSTFKKQWTTHYTKTMRSNHGLAEKGTFEVNDIVLILELAGANGIMGKLERIQSFMDKLKGQAIISYQNSALKSSQVNQSIGSLVKLVSSTDNIQEKGILSDKYILQDLEDCAEE